MFDSLPQAHEAIADWTWDNIAPYFEALKARDLNADTLDRWLRDYTALSELLFERRSRLSVATTQDTTDQDAEERYKFWLQNIDPPLQKAGYELDMKLLAAVDAQGLQPEGYAVRLQRMRVQVEIFREENLPLLTQETQIGLEVAKVLGAQTVQWGGEERTLRFIETLLTSDDRALREQVWRASYARQLQDRAAMNTLWVRSIDLREQMAKNAGFDNYRDFRWKQFTRLDYTPDDNERFHHAIETVVVPAATRLNERRRKLLGLDTLRPWDLKVDPTGKPPLKPYETNEELINKGQRIFDLVDAEVGHFYGIMAEENLLDLDNRKGKGPGGYCTGFPLSKRSFIFMNGVGSQEDVRTLLHEMGHATHGFLTYSRLPYIATRYSTIEFAEVAAMSMELLSAPYLAQAGFFDEADAARWRMDHLEKIIHFWPYMAVVDAFQLWAALHPQAAKDPANCDKTWGDLWARFIPSQDWSRLEDHRVTGWQRKHHIFRYPFYYVEYGIAQTGAVQVWANARRDQAQAVADYKRALALGGTVSLPELFAAAGAKFDFSADAMKRQVELLEGTIMELERQM